MPSADSRTGGASADASRRPRAPVQIKYPELPTMERIRRALVDEERDYGPLEGASRWRWQQFARICGTGVEVIEHVMRERRRGHPVPMTGTTGGR